MDKKRNEGARTTTADFIEFLDGERQKDKTLLAELARRLEEQAAHLSDLASRQVTLEDQLLRLHNQFARLPSVEEMVDGVKREVSQLLEDWRGERNRQEAETQALRAREREAQIKAVQEIREEALSEMKRLFQAQKSEVEHFSHLLVELRHQGSLLVDRESEQERRIDHLEGWAKQSVKKISQLELVEEKRAKKNSQFLEKLRSQEEGRRKANNLLGKEIVSFEETIATAKKQRATWEKQNQAYAKHREEIRKLGEDLRAWQREREELIKVERGRAQKEGEEWRNEVEKAMAKSRAVQESRAMEEAKRQKEWVAIWQAQTEGFRHQAAETEEWLKALEEKLRLLAG